VTRPATAWEFYITETIHERLKILENKVCVESSFIRLREFAKYLNDSLCTMPYYKNGTVLVSIRRKRLEMCLFKIHKLKFYLLCLLFKGFGKLSCKKARDNAVLVCAASDN